MSDESTRAEIDALKAAVAALQDGLGNTDKLAEYVATQCALLWTELKGIFDTLGPIKRDWQGFTMQQKDLFERCRAINERIKKLADGEDWKGGGR